MGRSHHLSNHHRGIGVAEQFAVMAVHGLRRMPALLSARQALAFLMNHSAGATMEASVYRQAAPRSLERVGDRQISYSQPLGVASARRHPKGWPQKVARMGTRRQLGGSAAVDSSIVWQRHISAGVTLFLNCFLREPVPFARPRGGAACAFSVLPE